MLFFIDWIKKLFFLFLLLSAAGIILFISCNPFKEKEGDYLSNSIHLRKDTEIKYYLNQEANDLTEITVREAFEQWEKHTHFHFIYGGRNNAGLKKDGKNTVSFMLKWPEEIPISKIAYCKNWYDAQGNIIESDIIFNMMIAGFTTKRTNKHGFYYIEGVLAHEIGHLIGLDHIEDKDCLMKSFSPVEESYKKGYIDSKTLKAYNMLYR
jgi:hypothetical protein